MGFLTAAQTAAITEIRTRAWNQPFTVLRLQAVPTDDFYDDPTGNPVETVLSGDYVWRDQLDRRFTEGGPLANADLLLGCSIEHKTQLLQSGTRLRVDGVELAIQSLTSFPETGELVLAAAALFVPPAE